MIDLDGIKARLARVWGKWPTKGVLAPGADELGPKAWAAHGPLRCHATEQGRARQWKQANADAAFIAAAPADIGALIAEVERLENYASDCEQHAKFAANKATALERAAVVAWLRDEADTTMRTGFARQTLALMDAADRIERGEHRREED